MVAINFPDSPTNGQEHSGYVWDATNNVWNRLPTLPALDLVNFSAVAPSNPQDGQFWFDTTAGKMYVYYNDGSSAQWVSTLGGLVGQTGTEGQQLIHNGTEWVAYDGGSRNLLYNGAMQVAQRGTSETGFTAPNYYTADRWQTNLVNLGTWTQTIESDGPTGSGFTKSVKMECTTADSTPGATDILVFRQNLEGQDLQHIKKGTSEAEELTLSFWVKSNVTGTYVSELMDNDNVRQVSAQYTINASDTWEKKTITFPADTTGALDNDNALSVRVSWFLGAGSNFTSGTLNTSWNASTNANRIVGQTNVAASTSNYWQITGVQLETGEVATPFEHKSYSTELAECQRYYYRRSSQSNFNIYGTGAAFNATSVLIEVKYPQTMRAVASLGSGGTFALQPSAGGISGISLSRSGLDSAAVDATVSSTSSGNAHTLRDNDDATAYLEFDAEL